MKVELQHPEEFTDGTRVLLLTGRYKDGVEKQRRLTRIAHGPEQFFKVMTELHLIRQPKERIYATVEERSIPKAAREFKHRQIDAEYDPCPDNFYRQIEARWASCLMAEGCVVKKRWMFDCDHPIETSVVIEELNTLGVRVMHSYATKNGHHIIVEPFNRTLLTEASLKLLQTNPLMLWCYDDE